MLANKSILVEILGLVKVSGKISLINRKQRQFDELCLELKTIG